MHTTDIQNVNKIRRGNKPAPVNISITGSTGHNSTNNDVDFTSRHRFTVAPERI